MDCGRNQKRRRKRSENAAFFNCLNFKIHRDFLNLLTLSNVVEPSLGAEFLTIQVQKEREKFVFVCSRPP